MLVLQPPAMMILAHAASAGYLGYQLTCIQTQSVQFVTTCMACSTFICVVKPLLIKEAASVSERHVLNSVQQFFHTISPHHSSHLLLAAIEL